MDTIKTLKDEVRVLQYALYVAHQQNKCLEQTVKTLKSQLNQNISSTICPSCSSKIQHHTMAVATTDPFITAPNYIPNMATIPNISDSSIMNMSNVNLPFPNTHNGLVSATMINTPQVLPMNFDSVVLESSLELKDLSSNSNITDSSIMNMRNVNNPFPNTHNDLLSAAMINTLQVSPINFGSEVLESSSELKDPSLNPGQIQISQKNSDQIAFHSGNVLEDLQFQGSLPQWNNQPCLQNVENLPSFPFSGFLNPKVPNNYQFNSSPSFLGNSNVEIQGVEDHENAKTFLQPAASEPITMIPLNLLKIPSVSQTGTCSNVGAQSSEKSSHAAFDIATVQSRLQSMSFSEPSIRLPQRDSSSSSKVGSKRNMFSPSTNNAKLLNSCAALQKQVVKRRRHPTQ